MTPPPRSLRDLAGFAVSPVGFGIMPFAGAYGPADLDALAPAVHRVLDAGPVLIDTADFYGTEPNVLNAALGRALAGRTGEAVLSVKTGLRWRPPSGAVHSGRPDDLRRACDAALAALGTERIDLFVLGRVDPDVPVEESVGAIGDLAAAGKVGGVGLSEVGPRTLRRAHAAHPVAVLQTEYSLWERGVEAEILPTARELGVGFVASSPLGRGFLAGALSSPDDLAQGDGRRGFPRWQGGDFAHNRELVRGAAALAAEIGATPPQVALAWLLARGADVVPIPGTRSPERAAENLAAADLRLTEAQAAELDRLFPPGAAAGDRYPAAAMATIAAD
jgi:aryl-alcohol dehydrogenase-like predicted oxidoreductase